MKPLLLTMPLVGLFLACGSRQASPASAPPAPASGQALTDTADARAPCLPASGEHAVFAISIDGVDVGQEVRTETNADGPLGEERLSYSHSVLRMRFRDTLLETREARGERTLADSGTLLRASHVIIDPLKVRSFLVGYDGEGWERLSEERSNVADRPQGSPQPLLLSGREIIGRRLVLAARDASLGSSDPPWDLSYYEPLLERPVVLALALLSPGTAEVDGQEITGRWVEARRRDTGEPLVRFFFDRSGVLWIEEYPLLRQARRRIPGPLALAPDPSELLVGLYSRAYLADPNQATDATFRLTAAPERLDSLALLGEPRNQTLVRQAPGELLLKVKAGSPDGDDPPDRADLGASEYVRPDDPAIVQALLYLRSGGKNGHLSKPRSDNATSVVAQASLLGNPGRFWADPSKVAGLLMHYVIALIPDKRHTFAMSDAVETLEQGKGDCTEHAVLFASLMRAQGIPTRLVTGLYLTQGGIWGYHMWNSYWDGAAWRAIDASTMSYRPGAVYVAIGRGASGFESVRGRLADFMTRTFSGVTFDLVAASNEGESLLLARPANPGPGLGEAALVNAVVLSDRGDHAGAIAVLDHAIPSHLRTLPIEILRTELLVRSGRHAEALGRIAALRLESPDPARVALLDDFELDCLLAIGQRDGAAALLHRIEGRLSASPDPVGLALARARYLRGTGQEGEAVSLLGQALAERPEEPRLLAAFADAIASSSDPARAPMLPQAIQSAEQAVEKTLYSDPDALAVLARALLRAGRSAEASWLLDHAFTLAPAERSLQLLRSRTEAVRCLTSGP